jgi:hypothetical protein
MRRMDRPGAIFALGPVSRLGSLPERCRELASPIALAIRRLSARVSRGRAAT